MSQLKLSGEGGEGGEAGLLGKGNYGTVKKVLHVPTGVCMAMKVRHSHPFISVPFTSLNTGED